MGHIYRNRLRYCLGLLISLATLYLFFTAGDPERLNHDVVQSITSIVTLGAIVFATLFLVRPGLNVEVEIASERSEFDLIHVAIAHSGVNIELRLGYVIVTQHSTDAIPRTDILFFGGKDAPEKLETQSNSQSPYEELIREFYADTPAKYFLPGDSKAALSEGKTRTLESFVTPLREHFWTNAKLIGGASVTAGEKDVYLFRAEKDNRDVLSYEVSVYDDSTGTQVTGHGISKPKVTEHEELPRTNPNKSVHVE